MKWIFLVNFVTVLVCASYLSDDELESDDRDGEIEKFDISAGKAPTDEVENYEDFVESEGNF